MESQTVANVVRILRSRLEDFRSMKPNLSVRAIAKHSNVNRYFLTKILHEDPESIGTLDFHQILLLTKFLASTDTLKNTIDESEDQLQQALLKVFDADYQCDFSEQQNCEDLSDYLRDFDQFIIILLAANRGTKRQIIQKSLVPDSWYKIDKLIQDGLLAEDSQQIISMKSRQWPRMPHHILHQHIPSLISRYYSYDHIGDGKSFLGLYHENINEKTMIEFRKLCKEFVIQANNLIDNPENKGEIPVFMSICLDRIVDPPSN